MGRQRKPRRKPLGKSLPPAPEEEYTSEAMRAYAEQQTRQWIMKHATPETRGLWFAEQPELEGNEI